MKALATLRIVLALAAGSLLKTRSRTVVVGLLLAFGTFLTVSGNALLDSIDSRMGEAITGTLAGHLQVYSADAKDKLTLYGGGFMGAEEIGSLPSVKTVREAVTGLDDVAAFVPMGKKFVNVLALNETEIAIEELRRVQATEGRPRDLAISKIRQLATLVRDERRKGMEITRDSVKTAAQLADAERVLSDAFWDEFRRDPEAALTFLDASLAPLDRSGDIFYLNLLGTDLDLFRRVFPRFEITDGRMIPPGEHGLMMSKYTYEKWAKNKLARNLDRIREDLHVKGRTIAEEPELRELVRQMAGQTGHVTFGLSPENAVVLETELSARFPGVTGGLPELLKAFLAVDDGNFDERYAWYYSHIAPRIALYRYPVGCTMTVSAFTKSGYVKSRNLKFWGTYSFEGLESTEIAGAFSLTDLPTFRELHGYMDEARMRELADIRGKAGVKDVDRERAEEALFGGGAQVVEPAAEGKKAFDEFGGGSAESLRAARDKALSEPVTQDAIDGGLFEFAAVVLKDPSRLAQTRAAIEALSAERGLGIQVMDWESASGVVGQFVVVVRVVLFIAITIIFLVALVIVNNSLVMSTMERASEIGTMRALGAQAGFVLSLFLTETLLLGVAAGLVGAGAAWGFVAWLGQEGIPASGDALTFLFGGPRLFPEIGLVHGVRGLAVILCVSVAAALFPALVASRVRPAVAMRTKE